MSRGGSIGGDRGDAPPLAANFREFSESSLGIFHEIFPTFGPYYQQICGKEGKFAVSLGPTKAKRLSASGGFAP